MGAFVGLGTYWAKKLE